jgi:hypothetical protein
MGSGQLCSLKPPKQLQVSEVKLACQELKLQISRSNPGLVWGSPTLPPSPHSILYYFNIMMQCWVAPASTLYKVEGEVLGNHL